MSVILRKRKLSDGRLSLFLDIHYGGTRVKEYLQIYLIPKPKDPQEKELNKINLAIAESTRAKREISINAEEYQVSPAFKRNADFNAYFKKYANILLAKGDRKGIAAYNMFLVFVNHRAITFRHVTETLAQDFKEYLANTTKLRGGTPGVYFRVFKKVVSKCKKEKIIRDNPVDGISLNSHAAIHKDVLTMEEIMKLNQTPCGNEHVKRAFLFSCVTGLRLCDIRRLTWSHIKETKSGLMIELKQVKTGKDLKTNLNADAAQLIGERGQRSEFLFKIPAHNTVSGILKTWEKRSGINKHLTYHVARHSFGTNLIYYGVDVKTASQLLGHTSLAYTTLYLHISDSMKQDAVNKLPSLRMEGDI